MPNQKNVLKTEELTDKVSKAKALVFAEYHGLNANQTSELRSKLKEAGGEITVAKNILLKLALENAKINAKDVLEHLKGPVATIFAYEDPIAPIKVLTESAKKLNLPTIKAGIIDGVFASVEKIELLSTLPSRDELLARVVGGLKSPLNGFVNVLGGSQKKLVYVLAAIADKNTNEKGVS